MDDFFDWNGRRFFEVTAVFFANLESFFTTKMPKRRQHTHASGKKSQQQEDRNDDDDDSSPAFASETAMEAREEDLYDPDDYFDRNGLPYTGDNSIGSDESSDEEYCYGEDQGHNDDDDDDTCMMRTSHRVDPMLHLLTNPQSLMLLISGYFAAVLVASGFIILFVSILPSESDGYGIPDLLQEGFRVVDTLIPRSIFTQLYWRILRVVLLFLFGVFGTRAVVAGWRYIYRRATKESTKKKDG
jgi:hypothetical protein